MMTFNKKGTLVINGIDYSNGGGSGNGIELYTVEEAKEAFDDMPEGTVFGITDDYSDVTSEKELLEIVPASGFTVYRSRNYKKENIVVLSATITSSSKPVAGQWVTLGNIPKVNFEEGQHECLLYTQDNECIQGRITKSGNIGIYIRKEISSSQPMFILSTTLIL